jgi:ubiquinone/menaquinone biosynthesis C-methylase UbiE
VLDLGSGTGQIALPISAHVAEVVAIDPEPAMLELGRAAAERDSRENITWRLASAADLTPADFGTFDLVCIGAAFHWMDRDATLATLDTMINHGGGLVIASSGAPSDIRPQPWQTAIDRVRIAWLGAGRRAGSGTYTHPTERHEQILERSPFAHFETATWDWTVGRDLDSTVGLQFSYSYCAPVYFGEDQPQFEADLRAALAEANPGGNFTEPVRTEALIAIRPC